MRGTAAALALLIPLAAKAGEYDPFQKAREQVVERIRAVVLMPPQSSASFEIPLEVRKRHEQTISAEFTAAGLGVIPSEESERALRKLSELVGGIWDPVTGESNSEKARTVRDHLFREMQRLHKIDGVVDWGYRERGVVDLREKAESHFQTRWTAEHEPLRFAGAPVRQRPEHVRGLFVWLRIADRSDVAQYKAETLLGWIELRLQGRRERRPPRAVLSLTRDRQLPVLLESLVEAYTEPHTQAPTK